MKRIIVVALTVIVMMFLGGSVQADLSSGLVAYYPFNGNADDGSGNGNDGIVNGATLTTDRFGNADSAFSFDGMDDYIRTSNPINLPIGNESRTISAWIHSVGEVGGQDYQSIVSWGKPKYTNQHFGIERGGDPGNPNGYDDRLFVLGWSNDFKGNTDLNFNVWHHVAVTFDGTNLTVYVNGAYDGSTTKTYNTQLGSTGLSLGVTPPNDGWHMNFNGFLDDIRIYNRALSETEIRQLYWGGGETSSSPSTGSGCLKSDLDTQYQAGMDHCKNNPSDCGITTTGSTSTGSNNSITINSDLSFKVPSATYNPLIGSPMDLELNFKYKGSELLWELDSYTAK